MCGADMFLTPPAIKEGDNRSVAKGQCLNCQEEHKYTVLLNPEWDNKDYAKRTRDHTR
jgi:hypothetical protein